MSKKQTVLTYEVFEEHLLPRIQKSFGERFDKLDEKISHLPTKEEYYAREDKTMNELKKLRDEVSVTGYHYEKTNERVDKIDAHLGISTATI